MVSTRLKRASRLISRRSSDNSSDGVGAHAYDEGRSDFSIEPMHNDERKRERNRNAAARFSSGRSHPSRHIAPEPELSHMRPYIMVDPNKPVNVLYMHL